MRSCSLLISSLITLSLLSSREGESSTTNKYLVPNVTGVCPSPGACQGEFVHQQPSVLLLISVTCVKCGSGTCQWLKSPLIFQRLSGKAAWGCLIFQPLSWRKAGTALPNSNRKSGKMANGISRGNWGLCREWCSSRAQVSQSQHCCLSVWHPSCSFLSKSYRCVPCVFLCIQSHSQFLWSWLKGDWQCNKLLGNASFVSQNCGMWTGIQMEVG